MAKKLHELLAAEGTAKTQAEKCRADLLNTFDKKRHLFSEKLTTFLPNTENAVAVTEEQSDLQSNVRAELKWLSDIWVNALDLSYQIADSNTKARADITLDDGTILMKNVPATALLELEKRANELHALIAAVPTLDPAKGFQLDADRGNNIYKAREETKTRTKKTVKPIVLYEATKEHPAQVQTFTEDVPVGTIRIQEWSGLITPADKADMLNRAEHLRRAIKQARARANEQIASQEKVGNVMFNYVFDGKVAK